MYELACDLCGRELEEKEKKHGNWNCDDRVL